jgi:hypothetical protein
MERLIDSLHCRKLTLEWMEAWKNRDLPKMEGILSENFFMINRLVSNLYSSREEWLRMAQQQAPHSYKVEFVKINVCGTTAVVLYRFLLVSAPQLNPDFQQYLVTDVWAHCEGGWKALSRQVLQLA